MAVDPFLQEELRFVSVQVLEDGDQDLELPELSPDKMFEVEAQAAEK